MTGSKRVVLLTSFPSVGIQASAGSATTLDVSRPARRSLALRPVGSPSRQATRLSRRLRRFRYLHRRSDSYRLERPSCRVGIAPTVDQHLSTAHTKLDTAKPPLVLKNKKPSLSPRTSSLSPRSLHDY